MIDPDATEEVKASELRPGDVVLAQTGAVVQYPGLELPIVYPKPLTVECAYREAAGRPDGVIVVSFEGVVYGKADAESGLVDEDEVGASRDEDFSPDDTFRIRRRDLFPAGYFEEWKAKAPNVWP
jgi:hypothetical protein